MQNMSNVNRHYVTRKISKIPRILNVDCLCDQISGCFHTFLFDSEIHIFVLVHSLSVVRELLSKLGKFFSK